MKICKDCKKQKDEKEFYGIQGECKECTQKRVSQNYRSNKKYYQEYEVLRNKRPERKIKKLEYQNRKRKLHKGKYKANTKVGNAVRDGRLIKQPCEICGNPKAQAHHDDYRKKLQVRWLCFKHHREYHKQLV